MDFLQRIGNLFTGGGWSSDKDRRISDAAQKKKEEEERRRQEAARVAASQKVAQPKTVAAPTPLATPMVPSMVSQPVAPTAKQPLAPRELTPNLIPTPINTRTNLKKAPAPVNQKQAEIEKIYNEMLPQVKAENRKKSIEERRKKTGLDLLFHQSPSDKEAEAMAMSKATTAYQEKYGYNADPEVLKANERAMEMARTNSKNASGAIQNTETAVDVMRLLPGAGLGELEANIARGNLTGDRVSDDTLLQEQMGLKASEIASLDEETRNKYLTVAKAGLAAGLLDLVGVGIGGLVKNIGRKGGTEIAKSSVKNVIKNMFTKQGAKELAIRHGISTVAGGGIGYGGTKYLGGSDEQAIQNAISGAGSGLLGSIVSAPFDAAADTAVKVAKNTARNSLNLDVLGVDNLDSTIKTALPGATDEAARAVADAEAVVQQIPDAIEIEPGSGIKSTNLAADAKIKAQAALDAAKMQADAIKSATEQANKAAPTTFTDQPLAKPVAPEKPLTSMLPSKPRDLDEAIVDVNKKAKANIVESVEKPLAEPEAPVVEKIETPIEAASKEVPAPVVLPKKVKAKTAEELADEAAIKASEPAPAKMAPPKKIIFGESPENGPVKVIKPADKPVTDVKKEQLATLIDRSEKAASKEERALVNQLIRAIRQGDETPLKAARLKEAQSNLDNFKPEAEVKITKPATRTVEEGMAELGLPHKPKATKKEAPQAAKTVQEDVATPKTEKMNFETTSKDNLNKNGTVNKKWVTGMIKEIQESDLSKKAKTEAMANLVNSVKKTESEAASAARAAKRTAIPPVEEPKVRNVDSAPTKGKYEGGDTTKYMIDQARAISEDDTIAKMIRKGATESQSRSFKEDIVNSYDRYNKMAVDEVIISAKKLSEKDSIGYLDGIDVMAVGSKIGLEHANLVIKESKGALNEADKVRMADLEEIIGDLSEKLSKAKGDAARNTAINGYLYKQMNPAMISNRVINRIKKMGENATVTPVEKANLNVATNKLKKSFDIEDVSKEAARSFIEKLKQQDLEGKEPSPAQVKKAWKLVDKHLADKADLSKKYHEVNTISEGIRERNIKEGNIAEKKFHGDRLDYWMKTGMLSSVEGRIRDIAGTNVIQQFDTAISDALTSVLGKTYNKVSGKYAVGAELTAPIGIGWQGIKKGVSEARDKLAGKNPNAEYLAGIAGNARGGKQLLDPQSGIASGYSPSPSKPKRWFGGRLVHTATALPTFLSSGHVEKFGYKLSKGNFKKQGVSNTTADLLARLELVDPSDELKHSMNYRKEELSSMHSELSRKLDKSMKWFQNKANDSNLKPWQKSALANTAVLIKNVTMPFTSFPFGFAKNLLTRQSVTYNTVKLLQDIKKAAVSGSGAARDAAVESAIKHFAQGSYDAAKLAAAATVIVPMLSDTDENDKGFSPPYFHWKRPDGTEQYMSVGILGPISGPIISMWAWKKGEEAYQLEKDNGADEIAAQYQKTLATAEAWAKGIATATGVATVASAGNPAFKAINDTLGSQYGTPNLEKAATAFATDIVSALTPSISRSVNSWIDPFFNDGIKAETDIRKADGSRDEIASMLARIGSGIVGVSQLLPRDDDEALAKDSLDRLSGGGRKSTDKLQSEASAEVNRVKTNDSVNTVLGNNTVRDLLPDESKKLYDRAAKGRKLTDKELESIRNDAIKGSKKLIENEDYDNYAKVKQLELDKLNSDPATEPSARAAVEYDIKVSDSLKKNKVKYSLYKLYALRNSDEGGDSTGQIAGVSQSEINKMFDPESEYYNEELGNQLLDLDKKLAADGVSKNSMNANKPKYSVDAINKSLSSGKGSKGLSSGAGVTNFGKTVGNVGTLKARELKTYDSPIPNLASQVARTNLKKKITIEKGVKL